MKRSGAVAVKHNWVKIKEHSLPKNGDFIFSKGDFLEIYSVKDKSMYIYINFDNSVILSGRKDNVTLRINLYKRKK